MSTKLFLGVLCVLCASNIFAGPQPPTDLAILNPPVSSGGNPYQIGSLQALWKLHDGSGTSASDSSGNTHTGTLQTGASFISGSCSFNGTTGYITVPNSTALNNSPITISAWVDVASLSSDVCVYATASGSAAGIGLMVSTAGLPQLWKTGDAVFGATAGTITTGSFQMLTVTWSGTSALFYINGTQVGTAVSASWTATTTGQETIGYAQQDGYLMNGDMQYLAVFNAVLTAPQISALYSYGTP